MKAFTAPVHQRVEIAAIVIGSSVSVIMRVISEAELAGNDTSTRLRRLLLFQ